MRQINPDVVGAFPITPSTEIPEYFSGYVADGLVDTGFIPVESEHSAMSTCIGASAAGARAMTATSSCGLAYMWELLYVSASMRLPIVMSVVNRALSGPININNDHSDSMGARDSGWIQMYAETNQEAYDNFIQAVLIAEKCRLPVMACQDGFITSHAVENITLWDDAAMKKFVGTYEPDHYLLNADEPMAVGPYAASNYCMEAKKAQTEAMKRAKKAILDVAKEFESLTGQSYGFFEGYRLDDAEYAVVAIGSVCGTAKDAVDAMRERGLRAGLLKIRVFRPFPAEEIANALKGCRAIAIMDRSESYNAVGGPLGAEVTAALYRAKAHAEVINIMYGLSGRDVRVEDIEQLFDNLVKLGDGEQVYDETCPYLGLRE